MVVHKVDLAQFPLTVHWYKSLPQSMSEIPVVTHTLKPHRRLLSLSEWSLGLSQSLTCCVSSASVRLFAVYGWQQGSGITSATRKVPCFSLSLDLDLRCLLCAHLDIQMTRVIPFSCSIALNAVAICAPWQKPQSFLFILISTNILAMYEGCNIKEICSRRT